VTGFCLRLHVEPTQLGPIDRASPYLQTPVPTHDKHTNQAQPKPSARFKKKHENIKSSTRMSLAPENYHNISQHWRDKFSVKYQHKSTNVPTQSTLEGAVVFWLLVWWRESRRERCPGWVGWSDGLPGTCGLIPFMSCMWCLVQSARPSLHSNVLCCLVSIRQHSLSSRPPLFCFFFLF
jgi:hypothetical protein